MAAYAQLSDVLGRAGALRGAFVDSGDVDPTAIEGFLRDVSGTVDAALAARGVALPPDDTVKAALRGPVADGALVLAIEGQWPGTGDALPDAVRSILEGARARYAAFLVGVADGSSAIISYVEGLPGTPSASSFWGEEPDYGVFGAGMADEWRNPGLAPGVHKTDRL